MEEKDFKSLSVQEQKEKIGKFITSWCEQDSDNRCAIVILGNRKNREDAGKTLSCMLGPGELVAASLGTSLKADNALRTLTSFCLMRPLEGLLSMLNKSEKEEE